MNKILLDWNPQDELIYGSEQYGGDSTSFRVYRHGNLTYWIGASRVEVEMYRLLDADRFLIR